MPQELEEEKTNKSPEFVFRFYASIDKPTSIPVSLESWYTLDSFRLRVRKKKNSSRSWKRWKKNTLGYTVFFKQCNKFLGMCNRFFGIISHRWRSLYMNIPIQIRQYFFRQKNHLAKVFPKLTLHPSMEWKTGDIQEYQSHPFQKYQNLDPSLYRE